MKNNNNKIIPIYTVLGKSGSGKSTVVKILETFFKRTDEKDSTYNCFKKLKMYTTRPQRNDFDTDYVFMKRSLFDPYVSTDSIIRKYLKSLTMLSVEKYGDIY